MQDQHPQDHTRTSAESSQEAIARHAHLLVIEPDELTRWSLATYLGRWFSVSVVASVAEGMSFLASRTPDAAVVSDALSPAALAGFESTLRRKNPSATIIRLVTNSESGGIGLRPEAIEKPFRLSDLARMLLTPDPMSGSTS